jgi:hypothetical protein
LAHWRSNEDIRQAYGEAYNPISLLSPEDNDMPKFSFVDGSTIGWEADQAGRYSPIMAGTESASVARQRADLVVLVVSALIFLAAGA